MSQDSSTGKSTTEVLTTELARVVEPVTDAAEAAESGDMDPLIELLRDIGIEDAISEGSFETVADAISGVAGAAQAIKTVVDVAGGEPPAPSDFENAISAVKDIVDAIQGLDDLQIDTGAVDNLGTAMLDLLLISYLEDYHGQVYHMGLLAGVIVERDEGADELRLQQIPALLKEPNKIPAELFGWGTADFRSLVVLQYLRGLVWELGLPADLEPPTDIGQSEDPPDELTIPVLEASNQSGAMTTGVRVVPVPGNGGLPGLAVVPFGAVSTDQSFGLGEDWTFNVAVSGKLDDWGIVARPESKPELAPVDGHGGSSPVELTGQTDLTYNPGEEPEEQVLLGSADGSRLSVKHFSVSATVEYDGDGVEFKIELPARGKIGVHPSDFDGFLSEVMPGDGIFYNFDVTVGWSSETGLFFDRGGTLEISIPQSAQLGPISMEEIYLEAGAGGGGGNGESGGGTMEGTIEIAGAASGSLELGPFTATVKRVGVEADVSFPEGGKGNLGPVDMELGFKPPEGVGLSIDAGAVTGGGYLEFDHENDRYAGVLQLKAADLTINAVGLLTTDVPGKDDGFSLLLVITGEFPPVQLGMGFTLNGVGGIVGVHRTFKADPLGNAVREGSIGSVMFPENPVANSQRIISDLRSIFPPKADTHVFGPLVKLGYGTPTLITADVGVVLEVPTFKIALLGRLSAALPDEKAPLVELNLAVVGVLDPPNSSLRIDATLYDSRVMMWSLSGDMALRSNWGDNPRFVLSVGGFNPRFEPPSDFPELDRIRASLGPPSGNPSVEFYGYFALTSNTVQAGAGVKLRAEAGPAKAKGKLQFDTLIQFDPFGFVIDIYASISVTVAGKGLSITLDGTLKGPGPFQISGKIKIDIFLLSVTANVDVTLGSGSKDEGLPPAKIMPELTDALGKTPNWSAGRPGAANKMVSLREPEGGDETIFAHPLAEIGVRQTVVPLDFKLEKFGNAQPTGLNTFSIASASVTGGTKLDLGAKTEEQFAPAQFRKLSDQEKMDSPAFKSQVAGQRMEHEGLYIGDDSDKNVRKAQMGYESTVIDRTKDHYGTPLGELGGFKLHGYDSLSTISQTHADALADVSAVANSDLRTTGIERFRPSEADLEAHMAQLSGVPTVPASASVDGDGAAETVVRGGMIPEEGGLAASVSTDEPQYVVASKKTLEVVAVPTVDEQPTTKEAAEDALAAFAETNPRRAEHLQVVEASTARTDESSQPASDESASTTTRDGATIISGGSGQQYLGGNQ